MASDALDNLSWVESFPGGSHFICKSGGVLITLAEALYPRILSINIKTLPSYARALHMHPVLANNGISATDDELYTVSSQRKVRHTFFGIDKAVNE